MHSADLPILALNYCLNDLKIFSGKVYLYTYTSTILFRELTLRQIIMMACGPEFPILTLACQIAVVLCYSSGSPTESCITLSPRSAFHGVSEQTSEVPYEINTSIFEDPYDHRDSGLFYVPSSTYKSKSTTL